MSTSGHPRALFPSVPFHCHARGLQGNLGTRLCPEMLLCSGEVCLNLLLGRCHDFVGDRSSMHPGHVS